MYDLSLFRSLSTRFASHLSFKKTCHSPLCAHVFSFGTLAKISNEFFHDFTFFDNIWHEKSHDNVELASSKRQTNITNQSFSTSENFRYDVILLNCPEDEALVKLCEKSRRVICADGGGNTMYRLQSMDRDATKLTIDQKQTPLILMQSLETWIVLNVKLWIIF
ncbi:hypothetical protein RFI_00917 [Reticulomyxa filosa]|uniref:Uncharacterized protein n=1 Tax=Reticulomyxa filosa TaxID=46433 RepID=X6PDF7_RETFI|nr:hypothetical protein RFI_00917 [Reticulomyxa filosa]|eukprot:ETO36143.1 hypothetical protein RFI_00917 [Reticulomyxa filosa]